jgi:hypothetical protein
MPTGVIVNRVRSLSVSLDPLYGRGHVVLSDVFRDLSLYKFVNALVVQVVQFFCIWTVRIRDRCLICKPLQLAFMFLHVPIVFRPPSMAVLAAELDFEAGCHTYVARVSGLPLATEMCVLFVGM